MFIFSAGPPFALAPGAPPVMSRLYLRISRTMS
jgi:hypothetical protein